MGSLPPEEMRPVIVAELEGDDSRSVLESAAAVAGRVFVPLRDAPVDASLHVLEVYVPGSEGPLTFLAEPLGPPTEHGFPLRIRALSGGPLAASALQKPSFEIAPISTRGIVRGRTHRATMSLSASHTADLSHVGPLPKDPDAEADALLGRALGGGKLTIEVLIGRGGVGAVYKATHRELRIPVAVKVLHESFQHDLDFCRRFYDEALAASRLDHPNVTRVIDFGQEPDGLLYFAMEFLAGEELRAILERERKLSTERIAMIGMQVCAGLSHAHTRGIVHRDVKPENLVLVPAHDDDGQPIHVVKVCDFGIAQHRGISGAPSVVAGTPEYMSPEQCRGEDLDARSDVYAVGIVLYEMATGQVPFQSERTSGVLERQQVTSPIPPSKLEPAIDPRLERIILTSLAKDRSARQPSMRELRAELRDLLTLVLGGASPPPPPSVRAMQAVQAVQAVQAAAPSRPGTPPPVPQRKPPPAWLERGGAFSTSSMAAVVPGNPTPAAAFPARASAPGPVASEPLAQSTAAFLQQIVRTTDLAQFAALTLRVEGVARALATQGDLRMLWSLSSHLQSVAVEGGGKSSRAPHTERALRVFADSKVLACVAEHVLVGTEDAREYGRRLLVNAGVAGAHGLYGARVKLAGDARVRAPFVALLQEFGPKAWPVVRAALEKILVSDQNPRALELAEDLLLCAASAAAADESGGHLVVKYLRVNVAGVCRAATASIVALWKDRAKPLLVGMLQSKDDVVRIAAIAGLKQLGAIDEHLVPRLHFILAGRIPAGHELRAAAAIALGHATAGAKQPALSLLQQIVAGPGSGAPPPRLPTQPGFPDPASSASATGSAALRREDAVVAAAARSLLQLGGASYRPLLLARAERGPEALAAQLRRLLG